MHLLEFHWFKDLFVKFLLVIQKTSEHISITPTGMKKGIFIELSPNYLINTNISAYGS